MLPASLLRGERRPEHAEPGVIVGLSHAISLKGAILQQDKLGFEEIHSRIRFRQVSSYFGSLQFLRGLTSDQK